MAQLVPDDLTQLALAGAHAPELETLAQLGRALPDSYTVFHGVHWTRQYKGHTLYGEVDFVVMNAAGALLCIEQKNGPLQEDQGRLVKRYRLQDIAILSCRGVASTALKDVERVGNRTLKRFTNDYDLLGNQVYSRGQVLFETVRRFNGKQAPAVILIDVDPKTERLTQELQVLFCGMTRATVRLEILCQAENPVVVERLLPLQARD